MSVYTVARDDFTNARRSYVVLGVVGIFTALVALVFVSEIDIYDDAYRALWDVSALVAFAFPLFVAPLTYLAVAGDRSSGTITYLLGLPNTRGEYFLAKYVSRAGVAVGAVILGVAAGFVIALATFTNGADPVRFLTFAAVSGLFALAMTGIFLALSAMTGSRSRAMFAVIAVYFLLVPFWFGFLPFINLGTVLDAVASLPGISLSDSARDLLGVLSPATAYLQSTEFVYSGVMDQYPEFQQFDSGSSSLASNPLFTSAVLAGWAVIAPLVGYLRFRSAELG